MRRVVFDTNNWVSSLLKETFQQRIHHVRKQQGISVLVSEELIDEIRMTIEKKEYLRARIHTDRLEELIQMLRNDSIMIDVHSTINICRDPKDNFLLALSQDGSADYLITGDDDLLALGAFGKTKIITLSELEKE